MQNWYYEFIYLSPESSYMNLKNHWQVWKIQTYDFWIFMHMDITRICDGIFLYHDM